MTTDDFDKLRLHDNIVGHNSVDGSTHRGEVAELFSRLGRVLQIKIKWGDGSTREVFRDELFEFPDAFSTFTVEAK